MKKLTMLLCIVTMSINLFCQGGKQMATKTGSSNIIWSDYPDLDVIRVEDTYYMVSTTMHFMPGCVILKSYNLLDWEFCTYVYDKLEVTLGETLKDNKGVYGRGMWAASIRYNKGKFYISFVANDTHKTYLYTSDNIQGPWTKQNIEGFYHDMSILFDDDGRNYVVYGNTEIHLTELDETLTKPKAGGINKVIIKDDKDKVFLGYEGSHIYKINGKYYIFMIHLPKGQMRTEGCYVADNIEGPWTGCDVLCADVGGWNSGAAQGGIVQTPEGKWYAVLFQDHGALGRIPILVPVEFKDGFPVFGVDGKVPVEITVQDNRPDYKYAPLYSNDFTNPAWQWNHIPDSKLTSVSQNSFAVTTDKVVKNVTQASNTLTQRTFTEECEGSVTVDASALNDGDIAGMCALEGEYGFIGIMKAGDKLKLVTAEHKIPYETWAMGVHDDSVPNFITQKMIEKPVVTLKLKFTLHKDNQQVQLMYLDEATGKFEQLGPAVKLRYTLDQFVGVRFALFNYSTKKAGGKATFTDFNYSF